MFSANLLGTGAWAAQTASVSGRVVDASTGLPLAAVSVEAVGVTHAFAHTDSTGRFTIGGLVPGSYHLLLTFGGYQKTSSDEFAISSDITSLTLSMSRQNGSTGVRTLGRTT